jgi:hypothetical protein
MMVRQLSLVAIGLALLISLSSAAQVSNPQRTTQTPGTASISGVVVAVGTNAPIAGARVEARRADCNNQGGESASTTTDSEGRFLLEKLHGGGWCVGAAHPSGQYTPAEYLQRGALGRGMTLALADGAKAQNVRISMTPTGGIAGRIMDADGEPMGRVRVMVMEAFYEDGRKRLYTLNVVQSDDMGEFRFFWLPPGQYYVAAIPEDTDRQRVMFNVSPPGSGGHRMDVLPPVYKRRITPRGEVIDEAYLAVYYPGAIDSQRAAPVDVQPGVTTSGVTFGFAGAKVRAWHVRGTAASAVIPNAPRGGQANNMPPPVQIRLAPRDWTPIAVMPSATSDATGNFDIAGVVSGSYVLYASAPQASARIPLDVTGDIDNLRVVATGGYALSGRLSIEGQSVLNPQDLGGLRFNILRDPNFPGVPASPTNGGINANNLSFSLMNVFPGDYRVYLSPFLNPSQRGSAAPPPRLPDLYLKSIRMGAADLLTDGLHVSGPLEAPIEVVLARAGTIAGKVIDTKGQPAGNVKVALVPDISLRRRFDLFRTATTDQSGAFQMRGVAPGEYTAIAWEQVADGAWQEPEFLRAYEPAGRPVHVSEGAQSSVDLNLISAEVR